VWKTAAPYDIVTGFLYRDPGHRRFTTRARIVRIFSVQAGPTFCVILA